MKAPLSIIKSKLRELLKNKRLANSIFLGFLCIDGLGVVYPEFFNRNAILYVLFPYILVVYFSHVKQCNILYVIALCFCAISEYFIDIILQAYGNSIGLLFRGVTFGIYAYLLFNALKVIKPLTVIWFTLPMFVFIWLPTWWYAPGFEKMNAFYEAICYIVTVTLFIFATVTSYKTKKTKANLYLLVAAIVLLIASYFEAYNTFICEGRLVMMVGSILFYLTHYLVCWYFIEVEAQAK